MILANYGKF